MPSCATRSSLTTPTFNNPATLWVSSRSSTSTCPTRKSESVCAFSATPPASQRYASCDSHSRASARALPTPSSVAYSHSAIRIFGSIAGRPAWPSTARISAYNGAKSKPPTNSHTNRARWSGASSASRSTGRSSTCERFASSTRGAPWVSTPRSGLRHSSSGKSVSTSRSPRCDGRTTRHKRDQELAGFFLRLSAQRDPSRPQRLVEIGVERHVALAVEEVEGIAHLRRVVALPAVVGLLVLEGAGDPHLLAEQAQEVRPLVDRESLERVGAEL